MLHGFCWGQHVLFGENSTPRICSMESSGTCSIHTFMNLILKIDYYSFWYSVKIYLHWRISDISSSHLIFNHTDHIRWVIPNYGYYLPFFHLWFLMFYEILTISTSFIFSLKNYDLGITTNVVVIMFLSSYIYLMLRAK